MSSTLYISNGMRNIYEYFRKTHESQPTMLLDPITTIFRLAVLSFKQENTKIGIAENKIFYYEPNLGQGVARWISGNSRTDIQYLYLPLLYFTCLRHSYEDFSCQMTDEIKHMLDIINKHAINGLLHLKTMYGKKEPNIDIIMNCLDMYLHLLSVADDKGGFIKNKYTEVINTIKLTYHEFTKQWNLSYIKIILLLIQESDTKQEKLYKENIIVIINSMLDNMDTLINTIRS